MPTTPTHAIPYPAPGDPPNGAAQMQALALATATAIDAVVAAQDARDDAQDARDASHDAKLASLESRVQDQKVSYGVKAVTFTNGAGTLVHGAGWAPTVIIVTPATGSTPIGLSIDTDPTPPSVTQVQLAARKLADGTAFTGVAAVHYIIRA